MTIHGIEKQACHCCLPRIPSCRIVHGLCFAPDNVLSNRCILTRRAASRTSNFRPAWDFAKINTRNLVPLTKESRFRKNSLCSLIWPDFDSFESANWPLKSSTNFRIWWKICFCLWSAQVAYSKASQECSFRCKFELASPKRLVWHTRNTCKLLEIVKFISPF